MPYSTVPLRIIGGTSRNRSPQANNEMTVNWYPEITEGGINTAALLPWMGATAFATSPGANDRGFHEFDGVLYHVVDNTLYSVSETGTYTGLGTIIGNNRCIFSNSIVGSLRHMVIAAGDVYTYDGTTLTDTGLNYDAVASGPATITSTGSAESSPDDLLRPYAFGQQVYMFCEKTVEPFYDSGATTGTPLARVDNAILQKGLGGFYTIAHTDQFMYFLGDDSIIYQVAGANYTAISTPSLVNKIKSFDKTYSTAYTISHDGQDFYVINFQNSVSYVYSEQLREWFNLSSGFGEKPYLASAYLRVYDKDLAVDHRTANIVELTDSAYDELGEVIQRRRVLPPFSAKQANAPIGQRLLMSKLNLVLQTGTGLVTGQGSDPQIMVEYSLDGGQTWSSGRWVQTGKMGQYLVKAEYYEMISFYEITFRITISDPVFSSLHDVSIDVKAAGY